MTEAEISNDDLQTLAQEKILLGENLLDNLNYYKRIEGVSKIERKILQEIKFLRKVTKALNNKFGILLLIVLVSI